MGRPGCAAVRTFSWPLLVLGLLFQTLLVASQRQPSELGSSIILVGFGDFQPFDYYGTPQLVCDYAIPRARAAGASTISFVVTGLWVGGAAGVTSYAFKDGAGTLYPPDEQTLAAWQAGLQNCFAQALAAGFTGLHILPHIDDPADIVYRNNLLFDPTVQYSGFSYEEVILNPITTALLATADPASTRIWYTLAGELGRSTVSYSQGYYEIMGRLRARFQGAGFEVAPAGSFSATARVKMGVSFNWNKHCGCLPELEFLSAQDVNSSYAYAFAANQANLTAQVDAVALRALLQASDFIGVSSYAGLPLTPQLNDMELAMSYFAHEMSFWGVDIAKLTSCEGRQLIYSEQGLGGGQVDAPNTVDYIANHPEKGRWLFYTPAQDPWLSLEAQAYRRAVYSLFTQWLGQGGGPAYKVDAAYVWSVGSFDVQAIHPVSTSPFGSWGDATIAEQIRALNAYVNDPARPALPAVACPAPLPSPQLPVIIPSPPPSPVPSPVLELPSPVPLDQPVLAQDPSTVLQPQPLEQPGVDPAAQPAGLAPQFFG